jgi:primosomal protein N' (replication factor Y)
LTLVGVIDADLSLAGGDLRASEKTFQLLSQVAGRAGRSDWQGKVFLQTYQPENQVIKAIASNERDRFFEEELNVRRALSMPPFGRLVGLIISSKNDERARNVSYQLGVNAPKEEYITVMGPAPAPMSLLRDKYRYRLLLKASKTIKIQPIIKNWIEKIAIPSNVKIQIDIDPYTFF